jgi:hypothetical protein
MRRSWNLLAQCNSRRHSLLYGGLLSFPTLVCSASDSRSICSHPPCLTEGRAGGRSIPSKICAYWLQPNIRPLHFREQFSIRTDSLQQVVRVCSITSSPQNFRRDSRPASNDDNPSGLILSWMPKVDRLFSLLLTIFDLLLDALRFIRQSLQPRCTLAAENLFLRKQLALWPVTLS